MRALEYGDVTEFVTENTSDQYTNTYANNSKGNPEGWPMLTLSPGIASSQT
jgi:hypothetical protein